MRISNGVVCSLFLMFLLLIPFSCLSGTVYATMKKRVEIDSRRGWVLNGNLQLSQSGFMLSAHSLFLPDETNRQVVINDLSIENSRLDISAKKGFLTRDFKEMRLKDGFIFFYGFSFVLSYKNLFLDGQTGFFIDGVLLSGGENFYIGSGFILFSGDDLVINNLEKKMIFSSKKTAVGWKLF